MASAQGSFPSLIRFPLPLPPPVAGKVPEHATSTAQLDILSLTVGFEQPTSATPPKRAMTSTLPISRSTGFTAPNIRHFDYDNVGSTSTDSANEWGPSSLPPTKQSSVPWDEQVVPALRKKLEQESQLLGSRISRIEDSNQGWSATSARSHDSFDKREIGSNAAVSPGVAESGSTANVRPSRGLVQHGRTSSIEQYHNRFGSLRRPNNDENSGSPRRNVKSTTQNAALSTLDRNAIEQDQQWSWPASHQATPINANADKSSAVRSTEQSLEKPKSMIPEEYSWQPLGTPPKSKDLIAQAQIPQSSAPDDAHQGTQSGRLRTKSTPMRPSNELTRLEPPFELLPTPEAAERLPRPHQDGQEQQFYSTSKNSPRRTPSSARRKAEPDAKLMEEFGPLGGSPSGHYQYNSPNESGSKRYRAAQPDAFLSLSPERVPRSRREVSAPAAMGELGSANEFGAAASPSSRNDWDEQIVPTVARRLRQQQLLEQQGRLSRYEGLIDRWDKDGNPLSINGDIVPRKASSPLPQTTQSEMGHGQPYLAMPTTGDSAHASRASAEHSTNAPEPNTHRAAETHDIPMQNMPQATSPIPAPEDRMVRAPSAGHIPAHTQPASRPTPKKKPRSKASVDDAGCCCVVM